MNFSATHRGFLTLLLLMVAAGPASSAQQHVPEAAQESRVDFPIMDLLQRLRKVLNHYKSITLPGLPIINIPGDQVSLTISLADVYLEGLNNWTPKLDFKLGTALEPRLGVTLDFKKISLLVGSYTSSGHILNLPFNGEGPMYIHLHDLLVGFSFGYSLIPLCAKINSTDYDLDLIRTEAHMENLNKGTDQGQLVDIVVPSFGQDIVERLQVLIMDKYHDVFDSIIVEIINSSIGCSSKSVEDILNIDELWKLMEDIVKDFLP